MASVAEVDRDGMRQRRKDAQREIEVQEEQRSATQPQTEVDPTTPQPECWICYSGTSEGELISPCKCRGSMQWVHRDCLHRWITTRVTDYQLPDEWGRDTPDRFACPNCETPFKFVGSAEDGQPLENNEEIWPSSGRWWLPNMFPRIDRLAEVDADMCNNFRWKFAAPLFCIGVQASLVIFTMAQVWRVAWLLALIVGEVAYVCLTFCYMDWRPQLAMLGFEVQKDGWGPELELRNVTGKGVQSSPLLTKTLRVLVGKEVVADPIVGEGSIGTISERWSQTFASIQHAHAMLMMVGFSVFVWGCHDWLVPDDLEPLPRSIRRLIFRVDAFFFLMAVNPPLLRCARVLTINVLVPMAAGIYPAAQPWLLWVVYSLFTSHVDIAFHTMTAALSLTMHARAAYREYLELAEQMETIWRVHKTGLRVVGARVLGDVASAPNDTPGAVEEPASASEDDGIPARGED